MFSDVLRRAVRLIWPRDTVKHLARVINVPPRTAEDWLNRPRAQPYRNKAAKIRNRQHQMRLADVLLDELDKCEVAHERMRTALILFETSNGISQ